MAPRSLRLVTMPLLTSLATAFRVKAPMHSLALAPRAAVPTSSLVRTLRCTPMMCADRTVVDSCTDKIRTALSPQVRHGTPSHPQLAY